MKRKKAQGIAQQVSGKLHASARTLQKDFFPYWNFIHERNPKMGKEMDAWLEI